MKEKAAKLGIRTWLIVILIGLAGQFAWAVENMYLNSYITYLNFTAKPGEGFDYNFYIALTNALSAITATLTTIIMGGLSDKLRKRKIFITSGYILWGIATASFGLVNVNSSYEIIPIAMSASTAGIFVIVIDCIMTFFGSTSNDAAFNSYITKNIPNNKRGKVEGILGVLPLVAMLIIFVALNGLTTEASGYRWDMFFYIIGGIVLLVGIASIFIIPKEQTQEKNKEKYFALMIEGFKPSVIRKNKKLYLVFAVYFIFSVAAQVYFPYIMTYIEKSSNISNSGPGLLTNFAIVMACALLIGGILSALVCAFSDKKGKEKMLIPVLGISVVGLFMMFFVPSVSDEIARTIYGAISGVVLILGYVAFPSILNSIVRQEIPSGKEGSFMGVRMIFVVALPMCIGPFIGSGLNKALGAEYTGEHGIVDNLPTNWAYIVAIGILLLTLIPIYYLLKDIRKNHLNKNKSQLLELKEKDKQNEEEIPFNVYPRPNEKRDNFQILNGLWDFAMSKSPDLPKKYERKIKVPYPVESVDSLIHERVEIDDYMFYHKTIEVGEIGMGEVLLLWFNGVDQICEVFLDGYLACKHIGGYTKFAVDATKYVTNGKLDITLRVVDLSDSGWLMRGKQSLSPWGFMYGTSSGVYKTVWLERVPEKYILKTYIDTNYDDKKVLINVKITEEEGTVKVLFQGKEIEGPANKTFSIDIENPIEWSYKNPHLYPITIFYEHDKVESYFGLRKIEVKHHEEKGIYLNDKKVILNGLLDQGYYFPNGLTPRSFKDYEFDILKAKELGFNCLRKHVKVEEDYFYYLCDKLGMLVIQDIPNGGRRYRLFNVGFPRLSISLLNKEKFMNEKYLGNRSEREKTKFILAAREIKKNLNNFPSVVGFTIFNEGWGEFEPKRVYTALIKDNVTNNKMYDICSGWYRTDISLLYSIHSYTLPFRKRVDKEFARPYFLSEFGGLGLKVDGHCYYDGYFSHRNSKNHAELEQKYKKHYERLTELIKEGYLDSLIYTQLSDCETEYNGLFTFDREVLKIDENLVKSLNSEIEKFNN